MKRFPGEGHPEAAALSSWALRLPGAELAALVWDGDVDLDPPPGWAPPWRPASDPGTRRLCFTTDAARLVLEIGRRPPRALSGRASLPPGPGPAWLEVQGAAGERCPVRVDGSGGLTVPTLPHGPMRLVVHREGLPVLATSWVLID